MSQTNLKTRILFAIIGSLLLAGGLQITIAINWGVSMFDTATLTMQKLTHFNFGNAAVLLHAIFLLILIVFMKKLNTKWNELFLSLISIFLLTRVINGFEFIANYVHLNTFILTLLTFLISVFIFNIGIFFMSKSNLFITPYDRFVLQLATVTKRDLGSSRFITDFSLFAITIVLNFSFNLHVAINIGTAYIIFTSGPQIILIEKLFNKLQYKKTSI